MKRVVLCYTVAILFLVSCREQNVPGLDLDGGNKAADSSYIASVESKQDKVVVIEELTGVDCANCPKAYKVIKSMSDANPSRILSVGMHPPLGKGYTEPIFGKSKYDFRVPVIDEIIGHLGGLTGGLPSGAINRVKLSSGTMFDINYGAWVGRVTPLLAETTPVNISLESTYKDDNNIVELVAKVALTEDVAEDIYLTAYVMEDDIEDYQNNATVKELYMHQHVFRTAITSVSGSSLNFTEKKAGTVLQKRISFTPTIDGDNAWNLDNCKILVFVHKSGTDQSILHGAEVSLK